MVQQVRLVISVVSLFFCLGCIDSTADEEMLSYHNAANLQLKNVNGLMTEKNQPFTGMVYAFFPNTTDTAEIIGFYDGKEHGEWKRFYPDGKLSAKRSYEKGVKIKTIEEWWENGQLKMQGNFNLGEHHGSYKEWNKKGQLIKVMNYNMGYEEGRQQQFYDDGKVRSNYVVVAGKRYGLLGTKNCVNVKDSIF